MSMEATSLSADQLDLLFSAVAIAAALGMSVRQVHQFHESGRLSTFKLEGSAMVCARRSSLSAWLAEHIPPARLSITHILFRGRDYHHLIERAGRR